MTIEAKIVALINRGSTIDRAYAKNGWIHIVCFDTTQFAFPVPTTLIADISDAELEATP